MNLCLIARVRIAFVTLLVSVLCAFVVNVAAQEFKTVHDGVEYAELTRTIAGQPVKMNLLRLDLTKVRLDVHHAMDAAIGTEKTSSIASRHNAAAAINAGFFRLDTSIWAGDAAGVLMIDRKLLSESKDDRVVIAITNSLNKTQVNFGHSVAGPMVKDDKYTTIDVNGINRQRTKDEVIVYTPEFGRSTLTEPGGVEFIVRKGRVTAISRNGSSLIPTDGFVLSCDGEESDGLLEKWRAGSKMRLSIPRIFPGYDVEPEDATNGVPQLIKNGKIDITWEQEKSSKSFVETRHPRTAVAKLKDGKFLMITVDGRSESSGGIGLYDLAALLLEFGAVEAMNLDGGGSTTMFLDGKVVNHPSDKEGERKVSDAILVTLRKKIVLKKK
ncbi:MAG TPA: phosphodiester glycosidase family protein [Pyrinomonadaceae bacterium]|nr:phosphodiester glycosidase family protein [Pyrinomonadaceae bacterium]